MLSEKSLTGRAVVIGAGTMGGGIAAQLANAGWLVDLVDVSVDAAVAGLGRVQNARPPLLFVPDFLDRITPGALADSSAAIAEADWIVEAVAEKLTVKQSVMALVEEHAKADAVVSSNTSGLSLAAMVEFADSPSGGRARGEVFRRRFLGSHFLNPPRYLKLLEVIPTSHTNPAVIDGYIRFAEEVLGHRVVVARDTPGFISTRIGIWHVLDTIRLAIDYGVSVEEADLLTGALIGRPRSGTFRMADLVGLDILAAIGTDQYARLPDDPYRESYRLPHAMGDMIAAGRTGEKTGAGFYKREGKSILCYDFEIGDYRPRREPQLPVGDAVAHLPIAERLRALQAHRDEPGMDFLNAALDSLGSYVEYAGPLITDDVHSVDRVMTWGFGWEMGPYAIAEVRRPSNIWENGRSNVASPSPIPMGEGAGGEEAVYVKVASFKEDARNVIFDSPEASMVDIGDGVACLEFHTKMNTFSPAMTAFVDTAREQAERNFRALVIANDAVHFSAGYNLNLFLQARAAEDWAAIDRMLYDCQYAFLRLKYAKIPVVGAPHGYTLGAGCECSLHCARLVASPELYKGLPEVSVGVVPAGGGTTEMLIRSMSTWDGASDPYDLVANLFERLAFPRNSTSAEDARRLGFLRDVDQIVRNADRQLFEAKLCALELADGYSPPATPTVRVLGLDGHRRLRESIDERLGTGSISEHDAFMADRIAWILCGGAIEAPADIDEDGLLKLERDVFIEVVRSSKSAERLEHVLSTGKPLRN